ncbi:MAG TPA: alpha/beta hydrolase [Candidatus Binataceae bacterium]|nr:alpha/beta hydrolase [Candidatus Binataceae bacterium]
MAFEQAATVDTEPTHKFVEVDGLKLHYLDWGGDPAKHTFLLLHGGGAHTHWWDGVAPLLTPCGRVIALDFRGHGESEWPQPPVYGPPAYVRDVVAVIKELGTKVVLVGHSMGGAVSQWVAVLHPELLAALVIVDAPHGPPPLFRRLMWRWRRRSQGGKRPELKSSADIIRKFRLSPPDTYMSKQDIERLALHGAMQLPSGNWAFRFDPETRAWRKGGNKMSKPKLKLLKMPVLILRGDRSTLVSPWHARQMHRKIKHSVFKEVPRAYHHVPLDNPAGTAKEIIEFVER